MGVTFHTIQRHPVGGATDTTSLLQKQLADLLIWNGDFLKGACSHNSWTKCYLNSRREVTGKQVSSVLLATKQRSSSLVNWTSFKVLRVRMYRATLLNGLLALCVTHSYWVPKHRGTSVCLIITQMSKDTYMVELPGLTGVCMQFWETMVEWTDVDALLLRSMTEGAVEVACWIAGWCGLWSCWAGLGGMPFSERNSSRSMYSNWKVSPSYGSVLSHNVGPKKADCGTVALLLSSSSFFSLSFSLQNATKHKHTKRKKGSICSQRICLIFPDMKKTQIINTLTITDVPISPLAIEQ